MGQRDRSTSHQHTLPRRAPGSIMFVVRSVVPKAISYISAFFRQLVNQMGA